MATENSAKIKKANNYCHHASEYCFTANVNFTNRPKTHGKQFDQQVSTIIQQIIGHINTTGGVGIITTHQKYDSKPKVLDEWCRMFSERLANKIPRHVIHSCITLQPEKEYLVILLKKSPELVTCKYNMYTRDLGPSNYEVNDLKTCLDIMQQPQCQADATLNISNLTVGNDFPVMENKKLEFKYWLTSENIKVKLLSARTKKCLLGFPNVQGGGHLIAGVEEDAATGRNIIRGQVLTDQNKTDISEALEECFENIKTENGKVEWNLDVVALNPQTPSDEERFFVHIQILQKTGGLFELTPESYVIQQDGSLKALSFAEWLSQIRACGLSLSVIHEETEGDADSSLDAEYDEHSEEDGSCPEARHPVLLITSQSEEYDALAPPDLVQSDNSDFDGEVLDKSLSATKTLSYTDFSSSWKQDQNQETALKQRSLDESISLLPLCENGHFLPPRDILISIGSNKEGMDRAIRQIMAITRGSQCLVLSTESWLARLDTDALTRRPCDHVCDVYVLNDYGDSALITIVDGQEDAYEYEAYTRSACKILKREIVLSLESCESRQAASKVHFYIRPYLFTLQDSIMTYLQPSSSNVLNQAILQHFSTPHVEMDLLRKALLTLLVRHTTSIRNRLGMTWQCQLTADQMEQLLHTSLCRFNLIVGPPGSGKSIMAHHLCEYFKGHLDKNRVIYVCTRSCFRAYVDFQDNATTCLVQQQQHMQGLLDLMERTHDLQCVIIDDVHNIGLDEACWKTLFMAIKVRNVHLYIFVDPYFQNYAGEESAIALEKLFHHFCADAHVSYMAKVLTEMLRNSQKVGSFIKANATGAKVNPVTQDRIKPQSSVEGDDVTITYLDYLDKDGPDNGLLVYVTSVLVEGLSRDYVYVQSDIAILVDDDDEDLAQAKADFYRNVFRHHAHDIHVHSASEYPVKGIVVDVLENFSGLDARYCIFVVPMTKTEFTVHGLHNTKYKIFIASRGVDRVDYVLPTRITSTLARDMMFDDFSSLIIAIDK
jgi:hypothetical protein